MKLKRAVFLIILFALASCEKKESVHITDEKVEELITDFIETVPTSYLYSGKKVVTVGSWYDSTETTYHVSLGNYVPNDCQHILGSNQLKNGFKIYFLALGEVPPFLDVEEESKCDIQPREQLIPFPSRHTETFFCYSKEKSEVVSCGNPK